MKFGTRGEGAAWVPPPLCNMGRVYDSKHLTLMDLKGML